MDNLRICFDFISALAIVGSIVLVVIWAVDCWFMDCCYPEIKNMSFKKFKMYYDINPGNWQLDDLPTYDQKNGDSDKYYVIKFRPISYYQYRIFYAKFKHEEKRVYNQKTKEAFNKNLARDITNALTKD